MRVDTSKKDRDCWVLGIDRSDGRCMAGVSQPLGLAGYTSEKAWSSGGGRRGSPGGVSRGWVARRWTSTVFNLLSS